MRIGASGAAALAMMMLVGCTAERRPMAHTTAADRRIEEAAREIQAHDRQLQRQRAEIEALRARLDADVQRATHELEAEDAIDRARGFEAD